MLGSLCRQHYDHRHRFCIWWRYLRDICRLIDCHYIADTLDLCFYKSRIHGQRDDVWSTRLLAVQIIWHGITGYKSYRCQAGVEYKYWSHPSLHHEASFNSIRTSSTNISVIVYSSLRLRNVFRNIISHDHTYILKCGHFKWLIQLIYCPAIDYYLSLLIDSISSTLLSKSNRAGI